MTNAFEPPDPGLMSATSNVPPAVPSVRQSSEPVAPSLAVKKTRPFAAVNNPGFELADPGAMSATSVVPAAVPSLRQSSVPVLGSVAAK